MDIQKKDTEKMMFISSHKVKKVLFKFIYVFLWNCVLIIYKIDQEIVCHHWYKKKTSFSEMVNFLWLIDGKKYVNIKAIVQWFHKKVKVLACNNYLHTKYP